MDELNAMDELNRLIAELTLDIMLAEVEIRVDQDINSAIWQLHKAGMVAEKLHNKVQDAENRLLKSYTTSMEGKKDPSKTLHNKFGGVKSEEKRD